MNGQRLIIPEFRETGTDGLTALAFEPANWPGTSASRTAMRVIHKTSGVSRRIEITDLDRLADWLATGVHELEIFDDRRTATLMFSGGYVEAHVWTTADGRPMRRFNHAFRTTLDPESVVRVVNFLDRIRRTGWEAWQGGRS